MKSNYEFKRNVLVPHIGFVLLFVIGFIFLLFDFSLETVIGLLSLPSLVLIIYFFTLKYERLFLYDDFLVLRSILGLQIIYYEDIKRIQINRVSKGKNINRAKTTTIECLTPDGLSICSFHPSFLKNIKDKKVFFSSIQTITPLLYIERVFSKKKEFKSKNELLFSAALLTLIVSISSFGFLTIM
ncbi:MULTISPECIES: DUF6585 family protein [Bacillus cereus group]|uniref:DUF6585 family protein n=1 Tax=Bacillus cereus group TaxID=86661 RepID=UPI0022E693CB|nr:DUF6585 family protein [Bacillus cereus group sp. TH152-1LC]MDA1674739.1 hypothetical protein [Bacillus cereus group sp. TH152-1LC]